MRHGDASRQRSATRSDLCQHAGGLRFRRLAELVAHLRIDKIVASPLVRAQETASLVARVLAMKFKGHV